MDEFGAELYSCPENLLVMFKRTLPQSIIDDLLSHPGIATYDEIIAFIRRRTDHRKKQILCDHAKKRIQGRTKASMNTSLDELLYQRNGYQDSTPSSAGSNIPITAAGLRDMIDEQFAALKGKGKGKGDKGKGAGARTRNTSKERVRFQWDNSCWRCRCKDHKRDKCAAYLKLCEPTGKAPEGYVSAYHKARKV